MLCSVKITSINKTFDLALIQWYNYKNNSKLDKYECPWLILTSQYAVHIIQRFIKNDEYFVNNFMF